MFKRIYIELSNYCNLNCIFCTPKSKDSRRLTYEEFVHILKEVHLHTKEICLHVLGEPLMHPDFFKIVSLINSYNIPIMLSTNGLLIPKLQKELMNVYIKTWNISLHATYQLNDEKRDYVLKEILAFIDNYQQKFVSVFHLRLWADTNQIIKKNNELIKQTLINHYAYHDKISEKMRLKDRVILAYDEEFSWPNLESSEYSDGYCLGTKSHVAILANGEVVACCLDALGATTFGNIFKMSFNEILNSSKFKNTRQYFNDNKCYLELCKHCSYKKRGR